MTVIREIEIDALFSVEDLAVEPNGHSPERVPARRPAPPSELEIVHLTPRRIRLRLPGELLAVRARAGISRALSKRPNVLRHRFSPASRSLVIEHDGVLLAAEICALVEGAEPADDPPPSGDPARKPVYEWLALGAGGVLALAGSGLALPVLVAAGVPMFRRALDSLVKERRLNVDVLDSVALGFTLAGGHLLTAAAVIGMVEGGEWMRDVTAARSRRALGELIADRDAVVWKLSGEVRTSIRVSELQPGDVIAVTPGDRIPVDGTVRGGAATVDERFLTGEPLPVRRSEGDAVHAMTVVAEGELEIVAGTDLEHSRAGRIVSFLERAPIGETRMSDHARRIGDRFVLPVVCLGGAVLAATGSSSRAASVITFDVVTGVRVSAPTTMLAALTAAARKGVLIKGASALESLAQVDAIIFDKTGTLTAGRPRVVALHSFGEMPPDQLLSIAASADHSMGHPLAVALCAEAAARGISAGPAVERQYEVGLGVDALLGDGGRYLVGNRMLMTSGGVQLPELPSELAPLVDTTKVWIARPPDCLGVVLMRDVQRKEASEVVSDLRARGIRHLMLLSGDGEGAARHIADSLGLDEWRARATPEFKAEVVGELRRKGFRVAVVGDGINDSMALALADVGVAMGGGSDIASSSAQVVLMDDDLTLLPTALDDARRALSLMRENLALISIPNLFGLVFSLLVPMSPAVAGILSNGSTILATANGLRPLNGSR
jgi:heavy metal translocating P-type ATPase